MQNKDAYKQKIKDKFIANQIVFAVAEIINERLGADIFDYGDIVSQDFTGGRKYKIFSNVSILGVSYQEIENMRNMFSEVYPIMLQYCKKCLLNNFKQLKQVGVKDLKIIYCFPDEIADRYIIDTDDLEKWMEIINSMETMEMGLGYFPFSMVRSGREMAKVVVDYKNYIIAELINYYYFLVLDGVLEEGFTDTEEKIIWRIFLGMIDNPKLQEKLRLRHWMDRFWSGL